MKFSRFLCLIFIFLFKILLLLYILSFIFIMTVLLWVFMVILDIFCFVINSACTRWPKLVIIWASTLHCFTDTEKIQFSTRCCFALNISYVAMRPVFVPCYLNMSVVTLMKIRTCWLDNAIYTCVLLCTLMNKYYNVVRFNLRQVNYVQLQRIWYARGVWFSIPACFCHYRLMDYVMHERLAVRPNWFVSYGLI